MGSFQLRMFCDSLNSIWSSGRIAYNEVLGKESGPASRHKRILLKVQRFHIFIRTRSKQNFLSIKCRSSLVLESFSQTEESQHEGQIKILLTSAKIDVAKLLGHWDMIECQSQPQQAPQHNHSASLLQLDTPGACIEMCK